MLNYIGDSQVKKISDIFWKETEIIFSSIVERASG